MTSAAAMITGGTVMSSGAGNGNGGAGTGTRTSVKDCRSSLGSMPDARSGATRSLSSSPASTSTLSFSASPTLPLAGLTMHEPERTRMRSATTGSNRRCVKDFNDSITCTLCTGYLVEATTVNDCLHTFCRSCIVKYLKSNKYCPKCESHNNGKPITAANLRADRTLRALVYKLVPGLHKSENQRMVNFYAEISSANNASLGDDPHTQGALSLLDDQNFFSPDEPISLSLEYHYDTLAEHSAASAKVPITYLQCPAAVTVHHLDKFILTKNGLQVGSDHIRVEIIYEDEVLPPDFTLMDVAYCFGYKRIAPMRFFYRILIHSTAKPAPTASTYHRVEGQDKNSANSASNTGDGGNGNGSSTTASSTANSGQQRQSERQQQAGSGARDGLGGPASPGKADAVVRPRENDANNSSTGAASGSTKATIAAGVNGQPASPGGNGSANRASGKPTNGRQEKTPSPAAVVEKKSQAASAEGGLKMVLVASTSPKRKSASSSPPPREQPISSKLFAKPTTQQVAESRPQVSHDAKHVPPPVKETKANDVTNDGTLTEKVRPLELEEPKPVKVAAVPATNNTNTSSELKCYVNLKKQTVVGGASASSPPPPPPTVEIPRLKIDLPRLKTKLSAPGERPAQGASPPGSSSSSAATSPSSAASVSSSSGTSSSGKSPVWPMAKEEYAKTIGLKPVYAVNPGATEDKVDHSETGSSSHRKRKKGKHSKEAGSSGKRRKLHAEISSQHDASLKMKVKLTEKPPKHERLKSSGNEEESMQVSVTSQSSSPQQRPTPTTSPSQQQQQQQQPPKTVTPVVSKPSPPREVVSSAMPKVIDITKDDDDVKFVNEQQVGVSSKLPTPRRSPPAEPAVSVAPSATTLPPSSKDKLSEMRAIRHKPMVYIPNLDRSLSADPSISSFIESVQAKTQVRPVSSNAPSSGMVSANVAAMLKPTPALIPTASAGSSLAGKSQPRTPILSPRTMQSYPPLAYPLTSSAAPSPASGSIRTMAPPPVKRSISADSSAQPPSKAARLEPPSLVSPLHSAIPAASKQPIHAPMFNFAKGANRAKAAQQAAGTAAGHTAHHDVPYRSPISSTYTKEMVTKKPIPNLLLPPSSVSVTKMSDMVSSSSSAMTSVVDSRPALEIVRIPPTAPVADKPTLAPFTTPAPPPPAPLPKHTNGANGAPKTTRPPPATIPLIKIKKPTPAPADNTTVSSSSTASGSPPGMTPLSAAGIPRPKAASSSGTGSILDLSGSRRLSDEVIILDHSPAKAGADAGKPTALSDRRNSIPAGLKLPPDMIGFPVSTSSPVTSSHTTQSPSVSQKTLAPLPKLTEINRNRNLAVRQPNASIRNIPNPSALAFRGAQSAATTVTSSGGIGLSTGLLSASSNGNGRANGNTSLTPSATSLSLANSATSLKSTTSTQLSNGSSRAVTSSSSTNHHDAAKNLNGSSDAVKGATGGGNTVNNANATTTTNNNNNNIKVANANTAVASSAGNAGTGGSKKTIEKVAAVLKAAAATVDNLNRGTSTASSTSSSASFTNDSRNVSSPRVTSSATVANSVSSTSTVTTTLPSPTTNGSSSRGNGDGIVTSVTTSSIAPVTGANGGSARSSPASIVNVI